MTDRGLILHLPLDRTDRPEQLDRSGQRRPARLLGEPVAEASPVVGAATHFAGDQGLAVTLAGLERDAPAFTLSAWIFVDREVEGGGTVFGLGDAIVARCQGGYLEVSAASGGFSHPLPLGVWRHVAVVHGSGRWMLYLDGEASGGPLPAGLSLKHAELRVGGQEDVAGFEGGLAHLRVHGEALAAEEIAKMVEGDLTPHAAFDDHNPLDCRLLDANDRPVIYIEDGDHGETLALELFNASRREIRLAKDRRHRGRVRLSFRPGTLARSLLAPRSRLSVRSTDPWHLERPRRTPNGGVELVLRAALEERWLEPGGAEIVTLEHVKAEPGAGSRVSKVLFAYDGFETEDGQVLSGERSKPISVVNHSGRPHPPLEFAFADTGAVLPGTGHANKLELKLTNTSQDRALIFEPTSGTSKGSELVLSVEAELPGEIRPTALGLIDEVEAIEVTPPAGWSPPGLTGRDTPRPAWVLRPKEPFALEAGGHLTIVMSRIETTNAPGRAPLTLNYRRLPGFWDGSFRLEVDKAPLHADHQGRVGVGTNAPSKPLSIAGRGGNDEWLAFGGNEPIGTGNTRFKTRWHVNGHSEGWNIAETGVKDGRLFLAKGGRGLGLGTTSVDAGVDLHVRHGEGARVLVEATNKTGDGPSMAFEQGDDEASVKLDGGDLVLSAEDAAVRLIGGDFREVGVDKNGAWIGNPKDRRGENSHALAVYGTTIHRGPAFHYDGIHFGRGKNDWFRESNDFISAGIFNPGSSPQRDLDGNGLIGEGWGKTKFLQITGETNGMLCAGGGGTAYTSLTWNALGVTIPRSLTVGETLKAESKRFEIAHPIDAGAKLVHACLEGPENAVYYRGEGRLEGGRAVVRLPGYFEALTRKEGRTVQLTAKGRRPFLLSYEDVEDGRFEVFGTEPDGRFSWEVRAVRADVARLEPEPEPEAARTGDLP